MKIFGNSLIINRHSLSEIELNLLNKGNGFIKNNDLFVACSYEDIWTTLNKHFNDKEIEQIKSIATNPTKAYITIHGLTEMNIPPFGVIYNPTPKWIKFESLEQNVNVLFQTI
jgi:hypothetical protein